MSVMAISAVLSQGQDPAEQHNGMRRDLNGLQKALSTGNLAMAQQAMDRLQSDLQNLRPPQNGIRPAASVNPDATMRADMQALQNALDWGDLPAAQQAFVRIQQDTQQIASAQRAEEARPGHQAAQALPQQAGEDGQNGTGPSASAGTAKGRGSLIDVMG
jgi:peptidoglycan hydrolase CwlO-like protein